MSSCAPSILKRKKFPFSGCRESWNKGWTRTRDRDLILCSASVSSADYVPIGGWEEGEMLTKAHDNFAFAIMGDLHFDPANETLYAEARDQIVYALGSANSAAGMEDQLQLDGDCSKRLFQVGDLGGYEANPGSQECFDRVERFLDSFPFAKALVLGNHDLEGKEFERDEENLQAWIKTFGQRHYWAMDCGSCLCIGLSTIQFRSAANSCHEVFIDDAQVSNRIESMLDALIDSIVLIHISMYPVCS